MKKITCTHPDGYRGYDGDKQIILAEGESVDVTDEKFGQLKQDFTDTGLFDFTGKPVRRKPTTAAEDD